MNAALRHHRPTKAGGPSKSKISLWIGVSSFEGIFAFMEIAQGTFWPFAVCSHRAFGAQDRLSVFYGDLRSGAPKARGRRCGKKG